MRNFLCAVVQVVSWGYLLILFGWLLAYGISNDRYGPLGMVNLLAHYLFFPLPLLLLGAWACRSRLLALGALLGMLAFALLWGGLFIPKSSRASSGEPQLRVMTYNVLAYHHYTEPILNTIRHEDPDVVLIQELNDSLARALAEEMIAAYPHQVLVPDGARGIGILSKFPLEESQESLPHPSWWGGPLIVEMDWQGQPVRLVDFHFRPTPGWLAPEVLRRQLQDREEQAQLIVDLAGRSDAFITGGDANSGHLSTARRILALELNDSWAEAGFGFGHTFPGSTIPGSDRPKIAGVFVPPWLARIDYIFYSDHFQVVETHLARFDGVSDHRGVVVTLRSK